MQNPTSYSRKRLPFRGIKPEHLTLLLVIVALLCSVLVRLICFRGYVGLDDSVYAKIATLFARNIYDPNEYIGPPVFPLRVGIIWPAALLFNFAGVSQWTAAFFPLVISSLFVILIFYGTKLYFGNRAGVIAAFIWAVFPLDIQNATTLLPDLPCAFFSSLGTILLLYHLKKIEGRPTADFVWGVAGGVCFGIAWLCKETVLYFVPFTLFLMIWSIKRNGMITVYLWLGVALGSLLFFAAESIFYWHSNGDLFFRLHEMERNYRILENGFFSEGSRWGWPEGGSRTAAIFKRILITGPKMIFMSSISLYMPLLALIAMVYNRFNRNRTNSIPGIWMLMLFAMFNFSSSSMNSYMPLALFHRYLYPLFIPAIIIVSGWLDQMFLQNLPRKGHDRSKVMREAFFWGALLFISVAMLGTYKLYGEYRKAPWKKAWRSGIIDVYHRIPPGRLVCTDPISSMGLEFFWKYPGNTLCTNLEKINGPQDIQGNSYVLVNKLYIEWLNKNAGMWLSDVTGYHVPDFSAAQTMGWEKVWHNDHAVLYKVPLKEKNAKSN